MTTSSLLLYISKDTVSPRMEIPKMGTGMGTGMGMGMGAGLGMGMGTVQRAPGSWNMICEYWLLVLQLCGRVRAGETGVDGGPAGGHS